MPQEYTSTAFQPNQNRKHELNLNDRSVLTISGVTQVDSFDDVQIQLCTIGGAMLISGEDLHVDRLDLDSGEVCLKGRIDAMEYTDDPVKKEGFFSRLFR